MAFTPIVDQDFNGKGAASLPDQPTISASELKDKFDEDAKKVVAPAVNRLISELQATSGAASIGATTPDGFSGNTVQAVVNSVASGVASATAQAHSHTNMTVLNDLSDNSGYLYYKGNPISGGSSYTATDGVKIDNNVIKADLKDATAGSEAATSKGSTASREYAVGLDSNKNLSVNIPWTDTTYSSLPAASAGADVSLVTTGEKYTWNNKGTASNAFKRIDVTSGGSTTNVIATGEDTVELVAGSNVTLTATGKSIQIDSTGGGGGGGGSYTASHGVLISGSDIQAALKDGTPGSDAAASYGAAVNRTYAVGLDSNSKLAVNIPWTDTTYTQGTGITISSGSISVDADSSPTSASQKPVQSGGVYTALSGKADSGHTHTTTLATDAGASTIDLAANTTYKLTTGGTNVVFKTPPNAGHSMIDNTDLINEMETAITEGVTNDDVVSAYGVGTWSNCDDIQLLVAVSADDDGIGTWEDDDTWETSGVRTGWIQHASLHGIMSDDDVMVEPVFKVPSGNNNAVSAYAMRVDDAITGSLGGVAIKFNAPITANGYAGIRIRHLRTNTIILTP